MKDDYLAIILQSGDPERLHYAAMLAASAAALDWEITVVLLGDALRKWVTDRLDEGLPQPSASGATSLLFKSTAEFGRMTVLTCGADAAAAGLERSGVLDRVTAIQGLPSILLRIQPAGTKLYI